MKEFRWWIVLLCLLLSEQAANAEVMYGITFDGLLYSVSTDDASASLIGQDSYEGVVSGLEFDSATGDLLVLTAAVNSATFLYRVNPNNGQASQIGPTNWPSIFEGALQFSPTGQLYALNGVSGGGDTTASLLQLDVSTGQATEVVELATPGLEINGLAWSETGLIGIDDTSDSLVSINVQTGETTLFAPTPVSPGFFGGMASGTEGKGYYTAFNSDLYSFDLATGDSTLVGNSGVFFGGLAVAPSAVPEPSSCVFLAAALTSIVCRRRRNR